MRLHTKLILWLLSGLLVVISIAQVIQYFGTLRYLTQLSDNSVAKLSERENEHAKTVFQSVESALAGSLKRGEMEKFARLLDAQRDVEGLLEFSLADRDGAITHSTDKGLVGRELSTDIRKRLTEHPEMIMENKENETHIYQPQIATPDCIRCHNEWTPENLGGITHFRFSMQAVADEKGAAQTSITSMSRTSLITSLGTVAAISTVLAVLMFFLFQRFVRRPLGKFVDMLSLFEREEGDLTRRIEINTSDEIGLLARLFNRFIANLNGAIGKAQQAACEVGNSTQSQVSTIEQTAGSLDEISKQSRDTSELTEVAAKLMHENIRKSKESLSAIGEMTQSMQQIEADSDEMGRIIKMIDSIAFQTNLLSLNASVEAARAGEHGLGFAVVADEVRRLAMRTTEAAKSTQSLLEQTITRIKQTSLGIQGVNDNFEEIVASAMEMGGKIAAISDASKRQSTEITRINEALVQFEKVIQTNAAQVENLAQTMSSFKTEERVEMED